MNGTRAQRMGAGMEGGMVGREGVGKEEEEDNEEEQKEEQEEQEGQEKRQDLVERGVKEGG